MTNSSRSAALLALSAVLVALSVNPAVGSVAQENRSPKRPTIVLVHGAWADASSWNGVVTRLQQEGHQVTAIANPLRSLTSDAAYVRTFLEAQTGPIVLVGHSYGGAVITNAATGNPNVKALVYVNAFAPDAGERVVSLAGPDSALSGDPTTVFDFVPATLPPTPSTDLYIKRSVVLRAFADGLSTADRALVAATQRPAALAIDEPSGTPAWRTIPSWSLVGTKDKVIPYNAQMAMARKAGATIVEYGAGHLGPMTDPRAVTRVVERAVRATVQAR
ncbi:alpha/beta fold hydrolase [Lentzea cavernae]|uniref:Alpha/beta hydrolase n=1 Tax=Lentzea cavernae TaxID=2020703 RepID=A0ABQ3MDB8_9PSEU|nr:alpha/beta hydrolase [Lentzea cavernae]GHH40712.1 alpha/beta hydrolase [Lentzea cavernae]